MPKDCPRYLAAEGSSVIVSQMPGSERFRIWLEDILWQLCLDLIIYRHSTHFCLLSFMRILKLIKTSFVFELADL